MRRRAHDDLLESTESKIHVRMREEAEERVRNDVASEHVGRHANKKEAAEHEHLLKDTFRDVGARRLPHGKLLTAVMKGVKPPQERYRVKELVLHPAPEVSDEEHEHDLDAEGQPRGPLHAIAAPGQDESEPAEQDVGENIADGTAERGSEKGVSQVMPTLPIVLPPLGAVWKKGFES
jgi:hypothetical protein